MNDTPKVYISGCMTGKPNFNYDRFNRIDEVLSNGAGFICINPAKMDVDEGRDGMTWHDFMRRDANVIFREATMMVVFDDWTNSRGATDEVYMAFLSGIPVYRFVEQYEDGEFAPNIIYDVFTYDDEHYALIDDVELPVALQAKQVVLGPRRAMYGHPLDNWVQVANMMTAAIQHKLLPGERFDVRDVMTVMQFTKISREYNNVKRDNAVDGAGYWYAYDECLTEAERRGMLTGLLTGTRNAGLITNAAPGFDSVKK